jgi:hypothetical protein
VLLRRVATSDHGSKPIRVRGRYRKRNAGSHAADSHAASQAGIPNGIQSSDLIH